MENTKLDAFDADIKNNSLAISSDEKIAIVSNSGIDKIKVYNLETKSEIGELDEFVTPRHIAFSENGKYFYISDSSYGLIREFETETLKKLASFIQFSIFGLR